MIDHRIKGDPSQTWCCRCCGPVLSPCVANPNRPVRFSSLTGLNVNRTKAKKEIPCYTAFTGYRTARCRRSLKHVFPPLQPSDREDPGAGERSTAQSSNVFDRGCVDRIANSVASSERIFVLTFAGITHVLAEYSIWPISPLAY